MGQCCRLFVSDRVFRIQRCSFCPLPPSTCGGSPQVAHFYRLPKDLSSFWLLFIESCAHHRGHCIFPMQYRLLSNHSARKCRSKMRQATDWAPAYMADVSKSPRAAHRSFRAPATLFFFCICRDFQTFWKYLFRFISTLVVMSVWKVNPATQPHSCSATDIHPLRVNANDSAGRRWGADRRLHIVHNTQYYGVGSERMIS